MLLIKTNGYSKIFKESENMKRIKMLILSICMLTILGGCSFKETNLENAKIYTTVYPIEYITNYLYGENSVIESIYPDGVELEEYELTDKQVENYATGDLFVYVGLGKEKDIAKKLLNENDKLLIIDSTFGLNYSNSIKELWLAPNNFLMLAKNVKNSLNEYLDNSFKEEDVTKKYDELYTNVSWVDAELRNIAKEAKENENNTLVVSTNTFKYLESYGFNIVSLEDIEKSGSENAVNDIKSKFKNSKYTKIIKLKGEDNSDLVNELVKSYKADTVTINDMVTNSDTASDYVSMQYENIALIRDIVLK